MTELKKNNIFCSFLVERRYWLLGLMLVLAVVCGVMVPRVNVNTDMTKYLPRDSEMKKGLDRMKDELGQDAANMLSVRAMYKGLAREEKDSVRRMLAGMEDVEMVTSVEIRTGLSGSASNTTPPPSRSAEMVTRFPSALPSASSSWPLSGTGSPNASRMVSGR